jgi:hypothetical protein
VINSIENIPAWIAKMKQNVQVNRKILNRLVEGWFQGKDMLVVKQELDEFICDILLMLTTEAAMVEKNTMKEWLIERI